LLSMRCPKIANIHREDPAGLTRNDYRLVPACWSRWLGATPAIS
jgi:hypothetical protein